MPNQRQKPFRPRREAEVTQCYNDGVLTIYVTEDTAADGRLPVVTRTASGTIPYQERRLGLKRYYEAKQNQIHAERVIRVPVPSFGIDNLNEAQTEDGKMYRIDLIQAVPDVYPPSYDLTLTSWESGEK